MSHVYSDMSVMYARAGDLNSAENYLEKCVNLQKQIRGISADEKLLAQDALVHLQFGRGRYREAIDQMLILIRDYSENQSIPVRLRAHLRRDYGELRLVSGDPEGSIEQLQIGLSLAMDNQALPDRALTVATIARAYYYEKRFDLAEKSFLEAVTLEPHFERDFPVQAAEISAGYGVFLNMRHRWAESRIQLEKALAEPGFAITDKDARVQCMAELAEADHHLHKRDEEKALRRDAKTLMAGGEPRKQSDTIDIVAPKQAYSPGSGK